MFRERESDLFNRLFLCMAGVERVGQDFSHAAKVMEKRIHLVDFQVTVLVRF